MLFISSFSFGLFLPDCCNFQHLRKLQIERHPRPRNRACVWGVPVLCYPYSHGFTHCLLVLRGHNRAPDQAAGLMQPTSMSCPHMQAAAELCAGCFLAKCCWPKHAHCGCCKLWLPWLGKHRNVEGKGVISQQCLQRAWFIYLFICEHYSQMTKADLQTDDPETVEINFICRGKKK